VNRKKGRMERSQSSAVTVLAEEKKKKEEEKILRLRLKTEAKAVKWTEETVNNEHMGKRSSKSKLCLLAITGVFIYYNFSSCRMLYLS
jgi:3'-phosphoadenosine 5'-phosphosulfate (PAPS) 3'-phosphatase